MALSPALRIRFANDCTYLAGEVEQLASSVTDDSFAGKLLDASERLSAVGEQWFDDCLVSLNTPLWLCIVSKLTISVQDSQKREIFTILGRANGFLGTGDDGQYAIDQSIVDHAVESLSTFSHDWKV